MQFAGIAVFVVGYASVYTGVQMLKRPPDGTSGSFLYWLTGIVSLGSPSGGSASKGKSGTVSKPPQGNPQPPAQGGGGRVPGRPGGR